MVMVTAKPCIACCAQKAAGFSGRVTMIEQEAPIGLRSRKRHFDASALL
jgi:hypothetical protein